MPSKKRKSKSKARKPQSRTASPKKKMAQSKPAVKRRTAKKVTKTKKRSVQKKRALSPVRGRKSKRRASVSPEREIREEVRSRNLTDTGSLSGRRSSDFEGVSQAEEADSESVDELVEEGNVFEAGAVAGVEEADNADEKEVHTHEVPEDDVPEEYLDNDRD